MKPSARDRLLKTIRKLLRLGIYPARHPLVEGLWSHEWRWFYDRYYDAEIRFLLSLNLSGQVIYDVGANAGLMTLFFARATGRDGRVVAFEPDPDAYVRLCRNLELNKFTWVQPLKIALGSVRGTADLLIPSYSATVSTLSPEHALSWEKERGEEFTTACRVQVETMDSVVESLGLPPPSFIKIDVESYELEVLKGGLETIRKCSPALFVEVHGHMVPSGNQFVATILEFVLQLGYHVQHIETQRVVSSPEVDFLKGHIFCTRRSDQGR